MEQDAVDGVLESRLLLQQQPALRNQLPQGPGLRGGHLDGGQVVRAQELGEGVRVDLVGFDLGRGNGLDLGGVDRHHASCAGHQELVDGPGVEGHFQGHLVPPAECVGEGLQSLHRRGDPEVLPLLTLKREAANLNELLVDIEPVVHGHSPSVSGERRPRGGTTATYPRSRRIRVGRRAASYNHGLAAHSTVGRPHGLPASPGTPTCVSPPGALPEPGSLRKPLRSPRSKVRKTPFQKNYIPVIMDFTLRLAHSLGGCRLNSRSKPVSLRSSARLVLRAARPSFCRGARQQDPLPT